MELHPELLYRIGITLIDGVGDVTAKKLISYCGGAEAVFRDREEHLAKIPGIGTRLVKSILSQRVLSRAEAEVEFIESKGIQPHFYRDDSYPNRLKQCEDGPVLLYAQGNMNLNTKRVVGIVGTRKSSAYGQKMCQDLVADLGVYDALIVSGLAFGIDVNAHRNAVSHGLQTVGVMAHGLDRVYPAQHSRTALEMQTHGGMVTEFKSNTNPDRENFPRRNRIVAGLCDALVVIESPLRGGSMITAEIAGSYYRDVFAMPGKVGDEASRGCHFLIKTNRAGLIESASDLAYQMRWDKEEEKTSDNEQRYRELTGAEGRIVHVLKEKKQIGIDELCLSVDMGTSAVAGVLLNLEFSGLVRSLPGKRYELN